MCSCIAACFASCVGSCLGKCLLMGSCPKSFVKRMFSLWQLWNAICYLIWCAAAKAIFNASFWKKIWEWGIGEGASDIRELGRAMEKDGYPAKDAWILGGGDYHYSPEAFKIAQEWETDYYKKEMGSRVTLSIVLLMGFLSLMAFAGSASHALLKFWVLKFTWPVFMPFLFAFLPNDVFSWLDWLIIPVGCIFLTLQMFLFLDLGFQWNDTWIENAYEDARADFNNDNAGGKWFWALIISGGVFLVLSLVCVILISVWITDTNVIMVLPIHGKSVSGPYETECLFFIWFVWGVSLIIGVISITQWAEKGAFLPSSIMICYFSYICWILAVQRTDHAKPHYASGITGLFLMLIALALYVRNPSIITLGDGPDGPSNRDSDIMLDEAGVDEENVEASAESGDQDQEENLPQADAKVTGIFLLVHTCAVMYFRFLFLELSPVQPPPNNNPKNTFNLNWDKNKYAFWVCLIFLLLDVGLFGWSVIAPQFIRGRDFS